MLLLEEVFMNGGMEDDMKENGIFIIFVKLKNIKINEFRLNNKMDG